MTIEKLSPTGNKIVSALQRALELNGVDDIDLHAALGSWGDTLPEADVLDILEAYNEELLADAQSP